MVVFEHFWCFFQTLTDVTFPFSFTFIENYQQLWEWSVENYPDFWKECWSFFGIVHSESFEEVSKMVQFMMDTI